MMLPRFSTYARLSKITSRSFSIQNPSFSEDVVRPFLQKTIRNVGETWAFGTSTLRKTLLETLIEDSTDMKKHEQLPTAVAIGTVTKDESISISNNSAVTTSPKAAVDIHPILGKCIHDLSYKSIYVANIKSLVNATVWEKQRTLRSARADLIAESKIAANSVHYIPGVIAVYHNKTTSEIGIFDGQHRVAALYILAKKNKWDMNDFNILIEVYEIEDEGGNPTGMGMGMGMVRQLFKEINSAEPVSLIDIDAVDDVVEAEAESESSTDSSISPPSNPPSPSTTVSDTTTSTPVQKTPSHLG